MFYIKVDVYPNWIQFQLPSMVHQTNALFFYKNIVYTYILSFYCISVLQIYFIPFQSFCLHAYLLQQWLHVIAQGGLPHKH